MYSYNDHIFLFICIGGIFLAAVYHTILYLHRKENLLNYYSQYLWVLLFYLFFRVDLFFDITRLGFYNSIYNWDEVIQMLSFMFYIRFLGKAIFLKATDNKFAWHFYTFNVPVIILYCSLLLAFAYVAPAIDILKISVRIYLLTFGLFIIILLWKKKKGLYYRYLMAAAASLILLGVLSTISMILKIKFFGMGPFYWLLISFFLDVIFFSAALGYLIKQEYLQRENSLKQLLKSEAELQQKELEKIKAIYETREEERLRIARDLHDDMGSTLSSINIYSRVVANYLQSDMVKANDYLDKIRDTTATLMENTTDLIWQLQTNYGESETIFERMHKAAIQLLSSANIAPRFIMPMPDVLPRLNIMAQKNCWLIFKEALNNVCKYSNATTCSIEFITEGINLFFKITDDGVGITAIPAGNGLNNMQQRTLEMGGTFTFTSLPGKGTQIVACLPLHKILLPL